MTWRSLAACRDNGDPFFPRHVEERGYPDGYHLRTETPTEKRVREAAAKAICAICPVAGRCLAEALATPPFQDFGIWGGTTEQERAAIRRRQRRAQARETTNA